MSYGQNIDFKELSIGVDGGTTLTRGVMNRTKRLLCARSDVTSGAVDFACGMNYRKLAMRATSPVFQKEAPA
jgi:hypothetical protein